MLCDECESFFSTLWYNLVSLRNTLRIHFKSHTESFENVDSRTLNAQMSLCDSHWTLQSHWGVWGGSYDYLSSLILEFECFLSVSWVGIGGPLRWDWIIIIYTQGHMRRYFEIHFGDAMVTVWKIYSPHSAWPLSFFLEVPRWVGVIFKMGISGRVAYFCNFCQTDS